MHLIKRKSGYAVRFYVEENGENVQKYLYKKGWTSDDALGAALKYKKDKENGQLINKDISLEDFLDYWYHEYVESSVGESTKKRYSEFIDIHIVPYFKDIKLCNVSPKVLQDFYSTKKSEYKQYLIDLEVYNQAKYAGNEAEKPKQKIGYSTLIKIHRMMHEAFKHAAGWNYILSNPADNAKPPIKAAELENEDAIYVFTDDELKAIMSAIKEEPIFIAAYISQTTGMRLGEVCGLQNSDVDMSNLQYHVRRTYKRINGVMKLKSTKTHRSKRPVPMLPNTDAVIKSYINQKETFETTYGKDNYIYSGHFCVWPDGSPLLPDYVTKKFKKYIRKLGMSEDLTFHSLRHTHATWLLRQSVHPKVVAERLGHTKVDIVLNRYSHLIPNLQKDILGSLDTKLFTETIQENIQSKKDKLKKNK